MDYKEGMHNPFVQCPYNMAHEVPKLRLQRHLLKCRKQYGGITMKACPFNATHIVPEREMKLHFENCGDRHLIEAPKYSLNSAHGSLENPTFHPDVPMEDWGEESNENLGHATRNYGQHNNHQHSRPVYEVDDEDGSNEALSQIKDSSKPNTSFLGFGRGRIHQLVAEMNLKPF